MNFQELIRTINRINGLVRRKATGSPAELSRRLGISERSVFYYIEVMKSFGAPIAYSRHLRRYYYTKSGSFQIGFKELTPDEKSKIFGGSTQSVQISSLQTNCSDLFYYYGSVISIKSLMIEPGSRKR